MADPLAKRYLELVRRSLLNTLYPELEAQLLHAVLCLAHREPVELDALWSARGNTALLEAIREARETGDTMILRGLDPNGALTDRHDLRNHAEFAHTMIGGQRLEHLQVCAETVIAEGIEGDFLEAGVWRGGACVLLAAVLAAHTERGRRVWIADSFQGVPAPTLPEDVGLDLSAAVLPVLSVGQDEVSALLARYDLLDDTVQFIPGWFRDSLPNCSVERLALLRIDADLFESTRDALTHLYPKVVKGGFVIIDDYGILEPCRRAVDTFRCEHGIGDALHTIDGHGVFWRRGR